MDIAVNYVKLIYVERKKFLVLRNDIIIRRKIILSAREKFK